jgi:hypothetical protein
MERCIYHSWSEEQRVGLLKSINEQIDHGHSLRNIADGNLKTEGWAAVRKQLNDSFALDLSDRQIKNQKGFIQSAFLDYQFLRDQPGFGWDDETHTITADQKTWDQLIKTNPRNSLAKLKNKPFPLYRLAARIFTPTAPSGSGGLRDQELANQNLSPAINQDKTVVKKEEVNPKKRASPSIHIDEDSDIEILDSLPDQAATPAKRPREGESPTRPNPLKNSINPVNPPIKMDSTSLASGTSTTRSQEGNIPPSGSNTPLKDPSTKPRRESGSSAVDANEVDELTDGEYLKSIAESREDQMMLDSLGAIYRAYEEKNFTPTPNHSSGTQSQNEGGPAHASTPLKELSATAATRPREGESSSHVTQRSDQLTGRINGASEKEKSLASCSPSTRSQKDDDPVDSSTTPKESPTVCPQEGETSAATESLSNVTKSTNHLIRPIHSTTEQEKPLTCGISSTQSQKEGISPVHSLTPPKDSPTVCHREGETSAVVNPMSDVTKSTDQLIGPINGVTDQGEKSLPGGIYSTQSQKEDGPGTPPKDSPTACPGEGEKSAVFANGTKQLKRSDTTMAPLLQHSISTKALKSLADLFMNEINEKDYIRFVRVLENEQKATTFLALVHTSSKRICNLWLDLEAPGI